MGRYAAIKNNFNTLRRVNNVFTAWFGNNLYICDILTKNRTTFYINYMRHYIKREVRNDVAEFLSAPEKYVEKFKKERRYDFKEKTPIWVCWFQGKENMPEIVRACFENLINQIDFNVAELVLITEDNFSNYIEIDPCIIKKRKEGLLSYTNLSDLLRVKLLATYGGLWIDATVFVTQPITKNFLERSFYSPKTLCEPDVRIYVSQCRWATWLMLSNDNMLFPFVAHVMNAYYIRANGLMDYFFMDYVIELAYENIDQVKHLLDELEFSNSYGTSLANQFNEPYNKDSFEKIYTSTQFIKLSYKMKASLTTVDGQLTNYGYLRKEILGLK